MPDDRVRIRLDHELALVLRVVTALAAPGSTGHAGHGHRAAAGTAGSRATRRRASRNGTARTCPATGTARAAPDAAAGPTTGAPTGTETTRTDTAGTATGSRAITARTTRAERSRRESSAHATATGRPTSAGAGRPEAPARAARRVRRELAAGLGRPGLRGPGLRPARQLTARAAASASRNPGRATTCTATSPGATTGNVARTSARSVTRTPVLPARRLPGNVRRIPPRVHLRRGQGRVGELRGTEPWVDVSGAEYVVFMICIAWARASSCARS